jgi:hypothetical protein
MTILKTGIICLIAIFMSALKAGAQGTQTISGTITDEASKAPLHQVVVRLADTSLSAITDEAGRFSIPGVPLGRHSLNIFGAGYEDAVLPEVLVTAGKEVSLVFSLRERINVLQEVSVTAGKARNRSNNEMALVSARSFNADETKRYAGALGDPSRMAANFAGVVAGDDSRNDIVVRGNSPAGMLWQLEGINIPNPNHYGSLSSTGGPVSMLNNNTIGKSDFLTSAFPAQYGNAMAGVFDIRLREGSTAKREAVAQLGFNGFEGGLEGPLGKKKQVSYLVNYRYSALGLMQKVGVDFGTGGATPIYQDLNYKITARIGEKGKLTAFGLNGTSKVDFLGKDLDTTQLDLYGGDPFSNSRSNYATLIYGISYAYQVSERTNARLTAGYSSTLEQYNYDSVSNIDGSIIPRAAGKSTTGKFSTVASLVHKFDAKNSIQAGLTYDRIAFNLEDRELFPNEPDKVYTDYSGSYGLGQAYVQYRYRVSNALSLVGGMHGQYLSLNGDLAIEPRVSARYELNAKNAISLGYGLHSQAQNIYTYFTQTGDGANARYTNKDLGFTKSQQTVLGYEWMPLRKLRVKAEGYYQHLYKVPVEQRPSAYSVLNSGASFGADYVDSLENNGTGENYGLDLTVERSFAQGYYFLVTGSLFSSTYKGSDGVERNTAFNSGHVLNVLGGKEFKLGRKGNVLSLNLKLTDVGGRYLTPLDLERSAEEGRSVYDVSRAYSQKQDDYFRMDIKVGYKKDFRKSTLEVAIDFQNVTNHQNIFSETYDRKSGKMVTNYQQGFFPVPTLRYTF